MAKGIKTGGRVKGSQNKTTLELRNLFNGLLTANLGKIQNDLDKLEPKDRITILLKLSEFVLPKLQSTRLQINDVKIAQSNLDLSQLTNDEVQQIETLQKKIGYKPPLLIKWGNNEVEI